MVDLSNTATPLYYGKFRQAVVDGLIPVNEQISQQMLRIDERIKDPRYFYDSHAINGFIMFCEDELTLTDGSDMVLLDTFKLWAEDLAAPSRGIYVRTPDRIQLSPVAPMAMENGHWRGVDTKSPKSWASGIYFAKWRRIAGKWLIESETYMTTACDGGMCGKRK